MTPERQLWLKLSYLRVLGFDRRSVQRASGHEDLDFRPYRRSYERLRPVKGVIRGIAWHIAPERMADRAVRWNRCVREREGITASAVEYARENGTTVADGPFAGLRYPADRISEIDAPILKLTGTYESDLQPVISEALMREPSVFVDIGTADGYYAVGFTHAASAKTHSYGFEVSPRARRLCAQVAVLNGVSVSLHGAATSSRLRALPLDGAFVLSDCEGAEAEIFDEKAVAALGSALVAIEVHEWTRPGVEHLLTGRFASSHDAELITGSKPDPLRHDEGRWLIFRPR